MSSDDAKKQKDREDEEKQAQAKELERKKAEGIEGEDDATGLRNQFNFSERASQTLNNALRERGTLRRLSQRHTARAVSRMPRQSPRPTTAPPRPCPRPTRPRAPTL